MSKAVVVGGTGAVGRELVGQLLCSPRWAQVVTVGRREALVPPQYTGWEAGKLKQVVVDMDHLESEAQGAFEGADAVFCALGTTRGVAGSADAFRKVDLEYVEATARAAKAAGVRHFSLCSAAGARAGVPSGGGWKVLHGLLYMKCKGQAEEAVKAQSFAYASIFRPGMLDRGDLARPGERLFKWIGSVPAAQVAAAMVADSERFLAPGGAAQDGGVRVFEMAEIKKHA